MLVINDVNDRNQNKIISNNHITTTTDASVQTDATGGNKTGKRPVHTDRVILVLSFYQRCRKGQLFAGKGLDSGLQCMLVEYWTCKYCNRVLKHP